MISESKKAQLHTSTMCEKGAWTGSMISRYKPWRISSTKVLDNSNIYESSVEGGTLEVTFKDLWGPTSENDRCQDSGNFDSITTQALEYIAESFVTKTSFRARRECRPPLF